MISNFESLKLEDYDVWSLTMKPEVIMLEIADVTSHERFVNICELQFNRVVDSVIKTSGSPHLEKIIGHRAHDQSPFLTRSLQKEMAKFLDPKKVFHFEINFKMGGLDVAAEECKLSVTYKIPKMNNHGKNNINR